MNDESSEALSSVQDDEESTRGVSHDAAEPNEQNTSERPEISKLDENPVSRRSRSGRHQAQVSDDSVTDLQNFQDPSIKEEESSETSTDVSLDSDSILQKQEDDPPNLMSISILEEAVTVGPGVKGEELSTESRASVGIPAEVKQGDYLNLPEFTEPDWHDILDLLEKRKEPCDLTGEVVQTSYKRHMWRSIQSSYAKIKVKLVQHLVDRAEHRFRDRIEQDEAVTLIQQSLEKWTAEHSQSVAWKLHANAVSQVDKAKQSRTQAIERVQSKISFRNENADEIYREFAKSVLVPPVFAGYIFSVLVLTDKKFHFVLKEFPPFNQGLLILGVMVAGITSIFVFRGAWKYTAAIRQTQWDFVRAKQAYDDAVLTISHAYREEVRLEQQLVNLEPLLAVMAEGYNSRWSIDDSLNIDVSTTLQTDLLPACVGFARAVEGPDDQVAKLQDLALRQVVKPGWRTEIIKRLGEEYGEKTNTNLTFFQLDKDLGFSTLGARQKFIEAFNDLEMAKRLGKRKLYEMVKVIHEMVLRDASTDLRPPVKATRVNGYENLDTSSAWLTDAVDTEDWIDFLSEILGEASQFSYLGLTPEGLTKRLTNYVESYAVIPEYVLGRQHSTVKTHVNTTRQIAPIDVAVRVDVSDWGAISAFGIFAPEQKVETVVTEANETNLIPKGVIRG